MLMVVLSRHGVKDLCGRVLDRAGSCEVLVACCVVRRAFPRVLPVGANGKKKTNKILEMLSREARIPVGCCAWARGVLKDATL